jgi:membrane protein
MAAFLREVLTAWRRDNQAASHAAALAYYALFSLTPLLALVIIIAGFVLGQAAAAGEVVLRVSRVVGPELAHTIEEMVGRASLPSAGIVPTLLSVGMFVYGATGIFGQLRTSFDHIFGVHPTSEHALYGLVRHHVVGLVMILAMGSLLLSSIALAGVVGLAHDEIERWAPGLAPLVAWGTTGSSFVVGATLCGLLFRLVPDVRLAWRDVWLGAIVTAVLFSIGKQALGWYLSRSGIASIYGAAGSLVLLLLWIFYSAQILLLGATFTEVYSRRYGSRRRPT